MIELKCIQSSCPTQSKYHKMCTRAAERKHVSLPLLTLHSTISLNQASLEKRHRRSWSSISQLPTAWCICDGRVELDLFSTQDNMRLHMTTHTTTSHCVYTVSIGILRYAYFKKKNLYQLEPMKNKIDFLFVLFLTCSGSTFSVMQMVERDL